MCIFVCAFEREEKVVEALLQNIYRVLIMLWVGLESNEAPETF
jgi:hypothetical protein